MNKDISVVLLGAGESKRFKSILKQNFIIHNKRVIDYSRDFLDTILVILKSIL